MRYIAGLIPRFCICYDDISASVTTMNLKAVLSETACNQLLLGSREVSSLVLVAMWEQVLSLNKLECDECCRLHR